VETLLDETEHLVHAVLGNHRTGVARIPVDEPLFEPREPEEIVLLLDLLDGALVDRAVAVVEIVVGEVGLARDAVEALVRVEFDVARVEARLKQFLDTGAVPRLGGADEIVVRDVETLPRLPEQGGDRVGEGLRRGARRIGCLLDFQTVFVGAGEEIHIVAEESVPSCESVTDDGGVGMAEVRTRIDVIDRCRQVVLAHSFRLRQPTHGRRFVFVGGCFIRLTDALRL
jgi:hypothetical protein